jgi:hypothetical protein
VEGQVSPRELKSFAGFFNSSYARLAFCDWEGAVEAYFVAVKLLLLVGCTGDACMLVYGGMGWDGMGWWGVERSHFNA